MTTPRHASSMHPTNTAPTMVTASGPRSVSKNETTRSLRANSPSIAPTVTGFTLNRSPGTYTVERRRPAIGMCTR